MEYLKLKGMIFPTIKLMICMHACMSSCFSHVWLFVTLWTIAHQTPLSMGFSRQENWRGLPCPPPGDFPNPDIELVSLMSLALAGRFFTTNVTWTHAYLWLVHVDVCQKASQYFKVIILQLNKWIIYIYVYIYICYSNVFYPFHVKEITQIKKKKLMI